MFSLSYMATFNMLCVFAGALVMAPSRERVIRFLVAIFIMAFGIALLGLYINVRYGSFKEFGGQLGIKRLYLNWSYAVTSGAVIAFAVALNSRFGSLRHALMSIAFIMMFYFLLVSSARGPLLSVGLVCILPLILSGLHVARGRILVSHAALSALMLVAIAAGYIAYLIFSGEGSATLTRIAKVLDQSEDPDLMAGGANRFDYFAAAIRFWFQAPIVGNGVGSFTILFRGMEVPGTHPHNIALEALSNHGIVGLVLLCWMFFTGIRYANLTRLHQDPLMMCLFLLFAQRLVAAMVNTEIAAQQPLMAFLGLLACRAPTPREVTSTGGSTAEATRSA